MQPEPKPRFHTYACHEGCPVEGALEQISGKWKGAILFHLLEGTMRFSELRDAIGGATARTLTKQLRDLESDGIVERTVLPVSPPHVDYSLTPKGLELREAVAALGAWGARHHRRP